VGFLITMNILNKKQRVAVYIDGSNLYFKLKELDIDNTTNFNYKGLCDFLVRDRKIISYRYYVGVVRAKEGNEKAMNMRRNQQKLFSNLEKQGFCIKRGYLMENDGKFHEKGVDVKIATDMIIGAYENKYDVAILISSDTGLVPAIRQIKFKRKSVEYIGFAHRPSLGLQKNVNISRLLIKEDVEEFIFKVPT